MFNLNNVIPSKIQTMKFSDIISVKICEYCYLQLIPTKSNKNNNTEQIEILINKMFKKTSKYISQANKRLIIEEKPKASFYIHITKEKVQFYFMIPKIHINQFKTKFKDKRNNDLLNANRSIVETLEEKESVGIFYNFIPTSEKESNYFRSITYKDAIKKFESGENLKSLKI